VPQAQAYVARHRRIVGQRYGQPLARHLFHRGVVTQLMPPLTCQSDVGEAIVDAAPLRCFASVVR
jgi:hypothetical protein